MKAAFSVIPSNTRSWSLHFFILLVAITYFGIINETQGARQQKLQPSVSASELAQRIHALVNEERAKHKLPIFAWDARLARIAADHSRDMSRRDFFSHDSPKGHDFRHRYRQGDYDCKIRVGDTIYGSAENIALTSLYSAVTTKNGVVYYDWNSSQQIARQTVDDWMQSSGHRKNILATDWRYQGIGVEIGPDNQVLVTQNFC